MSKNFILFSFSYLILFNLNCKVSAMNKIDTAMASEYIRKALTAWKLADYDSSQIYAKKAGEIYRNNELWSEYMYAESWVAQNYLYLANFNKGINHVLRTLEIAKKFVPDDDVNLAHCYHELGTLYRVIGDFDKGLIYLQKALSIWYDKYNGIHKLITKNYNQIGICYIEKRDYQQALKYNKKALAIRLKLLGEQHHSTAVSYNNIGRCYGKLNDFDNYLFYSSKSLQILKKVLRNDHPWIPVVYNNIAIAHSKKGEQVQALKYHHKALQIQKSIYNYKHTDVVSTYIYLGEYFERNNELSKAVEAYQHALIESVIEFNNTHISKNPVLKNIISTTLLLTALENKAAALMALFYQNKTQKDLKIAFETYQTAVQLIDTMRIGLTNETKQIVGSQINSIFEKAIEASHQMYLQTKDEQYLQQAFIFSEKSKAIILLEGVTTSGLQSKNLIPKHLLDEEAELKADINYNKHRLIEAKSKLDSLKITYHQNQLFEKRNQFDSLILAIKKTYPDYYQFKYDIEVAPIDQIQEKILDDSKGMLSYFVGQQKMYAFIVTQNKLQLNVIELPQDFSQRIKAVLQFINSPPNINNVPSVQQQNWIQFMQYAHSLYHTLFEPFAENISANIENIIIIPDGILNYLPFEILMTPIAQKDSLMMQKATHLPYLINKYAISYGYSATILLKNFTSSHHAENNKKCIAFSPDYAKTADPLAMRGSLNRLLNKPLSNLPGTQKELHAIASYFDGEFLFGPEASEINFKNEVEKYSIIHLAMHGMADRKRELNSKLVFTQVAQKNEDDTLYTYELYGLKLNADLVVLSACETGNGNYVRGEGIMSLARGFMYAGSRSVLQSIWQASDFTSPILMDFFYKYLSEGMPKDKALQQAKLEFLKKSSQSTAHPFFWAGFMLNGDSSPLSDQPLKASAWITFSTILASLILILLLYKNKFLSLINSSQKE